VRNALLFVPLLFPALLPQAQAELTWKDHKDKGQFELLEDGRQALVYNYGPQLPAGVPEDRRRCCYLHPVNTPAGVTVTDDFPADHYHHRGIFFGWAHVEFGGKVYDNWMLKGIGPRNESVAVKGGKTATLEAMGAWMVDGKPIVREIQNVRVLPARDGRRRMELSVTLSAIDQPVVLKPVRDTHKSYGGFNARFAPRTETKIIADAGPVAKDEDLNPRRWVEYEAVYGGKRAALRIEPDPKNPGAPHQWCLRYYGFAGAAFPGKSDALSSYTLEPGKTLTLRYSMEVIDRP
jgi:hypothetical protein